MSLYERTGLRLLHLLPPEMAHHLSLRILRMGLVPKRQFTSPFLASEIAGLTLPNPLGLAAGYDKNAVAIAPLLDAGFGFVELGAVTPLPQPGNPKPRLFRLRADAAVINRFGFNNEGMAAVAARLRGRPAQGVIGLNLGANKDATDRVSDYRSLLEHCGGLVDFVTVNISSPNTEKLRDLQGAAALDRLLAQVMQARMAHHPALPVFLKVAPDLRDAEIEDIAAAALKHRINALIATNTSLSREAIDPRFAKQAGGLSGQPLFARSTRVLAQFYRALNGQIPLIGVGGIGNAEQAIAKIKAGASALQLYSALVYQGLPLIGEILEKVETQLKAEGFAHISEAVGVANEDYC